MVVFSSSILNGTVKGHEKVLPSPDLLAIWHSLHEGEHGIVFSLNYKLVFTQLGLKEV